MNNEIFHWGVACSAAQIEGAANIDGKGPSIWDTFSKKRYKISGAHTPETSCSFYYRYKEDIAHVNSLAIPNFRFSISWPRILPEGKGHINQKGLDFYDRLIDECLEKNITPWITLYHWDLPQKLEDIGGWNNRDIIGWYSEYSTILLKAFSDRVKNWMALNEPLVYTGAGYFLGVHAPGKRGMDNFLSAAHHTALAQANGIRIIRNECKEAYAGTTFSCSWISPYSQEQKDLEAANRVDALLNRFYLEPLLGKGYPIQDLPFLQKIEKYFKPQDEKELKEIPDFIGIQNYTREVVRHSWYTPYIKAKLIGVKSRNVPSTMMNWEVYPESIYNLLHKFNQYSEIKDILVTENGAAYPDQVTDNSVLDTDRMSYLKLNIQQVLRAKNQGVRVKGYFAWSLTDNFEWAEGYYPRFGLIYINYTNQQRIIKESAKWYSQFINTYSKEISTKNKTIISDDHPVPM